jgi:hypothetical protein
LQFNLKKHLGELAQLKAKLQFGRAHQLVRDSEKGLWPNLNSDGARTGEGDAEQVRTYKDFRVFQVAEA